MMNVIVVTGVGEFTMEVGRNEPVLQIKQRIEQFLGLPIPTQTLTVCGFELLDGLDMEDYPIVTEGTKIDLTIAHIVSTPQPPQKIHIKAKISTRWINIEVDRSETVKSLKEKIHIVDGSPIKRLTLHFSGIDMKEDHRHLCEYGICDQSEIIVNRRNVASVRPEPTSKKLSFVVQTSSSLLNSAKIPMEMTDSVTINELRKKMLEEKILPRDDYFFIHKQRIMQENCSLRWHGVENDDYLYVFKGTISREN